MKPKYLHYYTLRIQWDPLWSNKVLNILADTKVVPFTFIVKQIWKLFKSDDFIIDNHILFINDIPNETN